MIVTSTTIVRDNVRKVLELECKSDFKNFRVVIRSFGTHRMRGKTRWTTEAEARQAYRKIAEK